MEEKGAKVSTKVGDGGREYFEFYSQPKYHSHMCEEKQILVRNAVTQEMDTSHTMFEKFACRYSNRKQDPRKSDVGLN